MLQHTPRAIIDAPPSLMIVPPAVTVVVVVLLALVVAIAGISAGESLEQLIAAFIKPNSSIAERSVNDIFIMTIKLENFSIPDKK
jgi:hypothetical protein